MRCSGFSDPRFGRDAALQMKLRLESFYAPGKSFDSLNAEEKEYFVQAASFL